MNAKESKSSSWSSSTLVDSDARWEALVHKNADGIVIVDEDGVVLFVNRAAEGLFSRRAEELSGQPFGAPVVGGDWTEVDLLSDSGEPRTAEMRCVPLEWDGRRAWLASLRDTTDRRRNERQIQALNRELEQRVKELEAFAYSVAHDLRNPLRSIKSFADLLLDDDALKRDHRDFVERISESSVRMDSLIVDLLELTKCSTARVDERPVDLGEVAQSIVSELRETELGTAKVEIGELPRIRGDATLLRQLFQNLISNAAKYTRFAPERRIEIGCLEDEARAVIFVKDNGVGFEAEEAGELFGLFQRGHDAGQFDGMGVGLAIVERIAERHEGQVWAEGRPDQGATFYVAFPQGRVLRGR